MIWSKEYNLSGSDHFPIILREKKENSTKQQQRWSFKRANQTQFQKKSIIITKIHDQESIEKAYSCLTRNILQAAENTILKTTLGIKKRSPVAWWNEECEREEKIVRAQYKKH